MTRRLLLAGVLSCILVGACSSERPTDETATITGRLVAGPTCAVETNPPDPGCAPRAVPDAEIVATLTDGAQLRTSSDQDGRFSLVLPPGVVTITFAAVEGLMGTPDAITATVAGSQTLDLSEVTYDTGIR